MFPVPSVAGRVESPRTQLGPVPCPCATSRRGWSCSPSPGWWSRSCGWRRVFALPWRWRRRNGHCWRGSGRQCASCRLRTHPPQEVLSACGRHRGSPPSPAGHAGSSQPRYHSRRARRLGLPQPVSWAATPEENATEARATAVRIASIDGCRPPAPKPLIRGRSKDGGQVGRLSRDGSSSRQYARKFSCLMAL